MNRDSNRSKPINGNAVLSAFYQEQNQLPLNYGMIRNNTTGEVIERIGSQPVVTKQKVKQKVKPKHEPTAREKLQGLVEKYNDMLVQNDMDYEPINFEQDYNLSYGFTPADYNAEIERLNQAINDRRMEQNQTINGGKYQGMELEGGMPSAEAVDNMSDEQFIAYMRSLGL